MSSSQAYLNSTKILQMPGTGRIRTIIVFWNSLFKRLFDISMALIGLLFLIPIYIYVAMLIKRDSPGPVFYRGPRMGKKGKLFKILKFRTMYDDQHSFNGPSITAQGDDRITPIGHWLRDTKINEFPQLWNVLIGEMSLVGPRPEVVKIAETWPADAAEEILSIQPGITSPASILYHDEERLLSSTNPMDNYFKKIMPDKIRLDRLYIRYHSFFSDIDIIFWTLAILVPRIAKAHIPEGYFYAGPFTILFRRFLSWFTLDLIITLTAVGIVSVLWRIDEPLNWGILNLAAIGVLIAFLFSIINSIFGANKVIWSKAQNSDAVGLVFSTSFTIATILILENVMARYHWLPIPPLPTMMVVTIGFMAGTGFLGMRYRMQMIIAISNSWLSVRKNKVNIGERVIIAGSGEGSQIANWLVRRRMFRTAFSLVGVVDHMDPSSYGMKVDGLWMLGSINDLPGLLKKYDIGIVLSTLPPNSPESEYLYALNKVSPTRIILLSDLMWIVDQQVTRPLGKTDFPLWLDERLDFKALYDTLTELPNWTLFQERLRHSMAVAKRNNTQHACVFVELDGPRPASDDLDRNSLLKAVANRLKPTKREVDTLARVSNNLFALLLENVSDTTQLDLIVKRISGVLSTPFEIKGQEIIIEPNIFGGICTGACVAAGNPKNADIKQCYECVRSNKIPVNSKAIL